MCPATSVNGQVEVSTGGHEKSPLVARWKAPRWSAGAAPGAGGAGAGLEHAVAVAFGDEEVAVV